MQTIPLIDIRGQCPTVLAQQHPEKVSALLDASVRAFGLASRLGGPAALALGDRWGRWWLEKSHSPYKEEILKSSSMLAERGVIALNLCYEWGCTSGAFAQEQGVNLLRVLDWPFPALGENMIVAHRSGAAGEFYDVTWPAMAGMLTGMAPGRFAAALNQAPMRRHVLGNVATDWVRNRITTSRSPALPPMHLLRKAFEEAHDYAHAQKILSETPVCVPVIYTLTGIDPDEGCVIEHTENEFAIRPLHGGRVVTANHFESHLNGSAKGWLPRAIDSSGRSQCMRSLPQEASRALEAWFVAPVANELSRLALQTNASTGEFRLVGTNGTKYVTEIFTL